MYILNIGMEKSSKFGETGMLSRAEVISALNKLNAEIVNVKEAQSDTEPTLVVSLRDRIDFCKLADMLHQEAIAVYNVATLEGKLYGRFSNLWGKFNKEFSLL